MKKFVSILVVLVLCLAVFAACDKQDTSLTEAGEYLFSLYKDDSKVTPSDFDVVGKVVVGDKTFTVDWTVDKTDSVTIKASEDAGMITIDINEKTPTEVTYVLTATVKSESGATVTKTFERTIPAYSVLTYAQYAAAEKGTAVVVEGIVSGIFSKSNGSSANGLYLQDANGDGGYYVYNLTDDPTTTGIKVGMTVTATGEKDVYNGLYEVVKATVAISDSTIKTVTPVDFTDIYKNAADLTDAALVGKQSLLVTLKGVEITGQDTANGYFKFKLGDKESYLRISSSNNCITKDEIDAFKALHTEKYGYTADVTGLIQLYNGTFYLIPVSNEAMTNFALPERTDAEKLAVDLSTVTVNGVFTEDATVTLPLVGATYSDVTFAWTSDSENVVIAADGTMTVTVPDAPASATITLVATCGDATETKTFTVSLSKLSTPKDIVDAAFGLEEGATLPGTYTLSGVIVAVNTPYSEEYKNVTVTIVVNGMTDKAIECFRLKGDGAETLAVGDNITVTGTIKNYKGKVEFDSGCTLDAHMTPAEVVAAAYALEQGTSLTGSYTLTGVITTVDTAYSEEYKNVTVTIQIGDLSDKLVQCYRLKGEGADTIAVGNTITVTGVLKNYKGTIEFDAGCTLDALGTTPPAEPIEPSEPADEPVVEPVVAPTDPAEIVDAAYALETGASLPYSCTLTGSVVTIDTPYSEQYGNITVTIAVEGSEDQPIMCFRLKGDGAADLAVGDVITVTGTIKNYNGTVEFDSGCKLDAVVSEAPAADTLATAILGAWTDAATGYVLSFTETTYETLQGEAVLNSWTYVWNEDGTTMTLTDVTGAFGSCIWEVSIVDGRLIVKDLTFGLSYNCGKN